MENEPKKHHYIPQFILRNFTNEDEKLFYWDIGKKKLIHSYTRFVFMNLHMYRDETNHSEEPTFIEKSLGLFESEISKVFKKLNEGNEIVLLRKELEALRIFLCLLSFRSDSRMEQYLQNRFDDSTRAILKDYAVNEDYADLWKREVEELSKCRTYQQIEDSKIIDPIIKMDFINALRGYYMTFVDARGGDFLITDLYPTLEIFPLSNGCNIHLHCIYPISPTRLLLLNHIMFKPEVKDDSALSLMKSFSHIKGDSVIPPRPEYVTSPSKPNENDKYQYRVKKVYSADVEYINSLLLNEARVGIAFKDADRIFQSLHYFNTRNDTKQSFDEFEKHLSE